ncbi:hypothetical protein UFOVP265_31 [uncultured Caudovirales phage]|jgi:hypothetical protein|uniref:Uncharacterized protein n=1 Tax=uncultured Caudovirales phage TaxID=2100421 RepID=A0A6J5LH66_9CAUD|nr:hypothetical protein UFOVP265_31 [uncultured Caudovirales phage]
MPKQKAFSVRLPYEIWSFIKKRAIDQDTSMNDLMVECLIKLKIKSENKLTDNNTKV